MCQFSLPGPRFLICGTHRPGGSVLDGTEPPGRIEPALRQWPSPDDTRRPPYTRKLRHLRLTLSSTATSCRSGSCSSSARSPPAAGRAGFRATEPGEGAVREGYLIESSCDGQLYRARRTHARRSTACSPCKGLFRSSIRFRVRVKKVGVSSAGAAGTLPRRSRLCRRRSQRSSSWAAHRQEFPRSAVLLGSLYQ